MVKTSRSLIERRLRVNTVSIKPVDSSSFFFARVIKLENQHIVERVVVELLELNLFFSELIELVSEHSVRCRCGTGLTSLCQQSVKLFMI